MTRQTVSALCKALAWIAVWHLPGQAVAQTEIGDAPAPNLPAKPQAPEPPDPTRATPGFEKTFRELSKGFRLSAPDSKQKEKRQLNIVLKAIIAGSGKPGSVLVALENEQLRWIPEGGEVSVKAGDETLTLRLEKLSRQGAHLRILPWNEDLLLR